LDSPHIFSLVDRFIKKKVSINVKQVSKKKNISNSLQKEQLMATAFLPYEKDFSEED